MIQLPKLQLLAEGSTVDTKIWYVLNTRTKEILASELTREEAIAAQKKLGGQIFFTDDGVFYNQTRDVSYSGRGWIDRS